MEIQSPSFNPFESLTTDVGSILSSHRVVGWASKYEDGNVVDKGGRCNQSRKDISTNKVRSRYLEAWSIALVELRSTSCNIGCRLIDSEVLLRGIEPQYLNVAQSTTESLRKVAEWAALF